jgi:hypothetical protein
MTQCPSEHSGALAGHRLPQAPQFALLDCKLTHVPTPPLAPAHCVSPAAQLQVPSTQEPAFGHAVPHDPQFALLVDKSTQANAPPRPAGHEVSPPSPHPATHVPPWQLVPPPQRRPQAPQFALSEFGFTQVVPHKRSPGAQPQAPPAQLAPFAHWLPHAPQLRGSIVRSTHALAQFVSGAPASFAPQTSVHEPPEQTGVFVGHTLPHAPQLFGSLCVGMQVPPQRIPLKHWHDPP